jgi:hypothetical protein
MSDQRRPVQRVSDIIGEITGLGEQSDGGLGK